jgi:copper homeostasis protein
VKKTFLLEISVESVEAAAAAERGGAGRIELCGDLSVGGLTPQVALLRAVRQQIQIPIFVMIRPRAGDFVYSSTAFAQMKNSIAAAREAGASGLVFGILQPNRTVDIDRTRELAEFAQRLPVTFHRAFDTCPNLSQALEDVLRSGATGILTSGGAATAPEGAAKIGTLVAAAGERVTIVPGAGINAENILQLAAATRARAFHSGLSSVFADRQMDHVQFEKEVRTMVKLLSTLTPE